MLPEMKIALVLSLVGNACFLIALFLRRREEKEAAPQARVRTAPPGCRECGAPLGGGHTGYCSKSAMRGMRDVPEGPLPTEATRIPVVTLSDCE